jgi:hypothetical protein
LPEPRSFYLCWDDRCSPLCSVIKGHSEMSLLDAFLWAGLESWSSWPQCSWNDRHMLLVEMRALNHSPPNLSHLLS